MASLSMLIKPASSLCNYRCEYCFYADVSNHREVKSTGIMTLETTENLIKKATENPRVEEITFAFQGGEPTLAGIDYFKTFVQLVDRIKHRSQKIHYALQTNGSGLDESWAQFLFQHQFLVGISLDGYQTNHDFLRKNTHLLGTYNDVMKAIEVLKAHKVDFNILTVLTSILAKHPKELYAFYKKQKFKYVQLIPCLPDLDHKDDKYALTPELFASFYKTFFDLWYSDYIKGDYLSVTLFDNVIPMFVGEYPQQCGMLGFCTPQFVIEADGSVYPCDFYVLDHYKIGNINTDTIADLRHQEVSQIFISEPKRMSPFCAACQFKSMCNGNCKRLNVTYFDDQICGYKEFLTYAYPKIKKLYE